MSERAICSRTSTSFLITDLELELIAQLGVNKPTRAPVERMRHLAAFNNYLNLFKGKCSATGDSIVQTVRPGVPFPVYAVPYWWSDEWDSGTYARPYEFNRSFFEQFYDLYQVVPWPALSQNFRTNENCEYVSGVSYSRNCYLIFSSIGSEDCMFGYMNRRSKDCLDCSMIFDCELCYDCVFVLSSYDLRHSFNCRSCRTSAFLRNCVGCQDCFGCVNVNQGQFLYFNEQLTESEFKQRMREVEWDDYTAMQEYKARFSEHCKKFEDPVIHGLFLEDANGDFIDHGKDCELCFHGAELQSCVNSLYVDKAKSCLDYYTWGANAELIYNCSRVGTDSYNIRNCYLVYAGSSDMEYCMLCNGCKNCFGCIGIRNGQYMILNQQYTKDEYQELKARIINQMRSPKAGEPAYGEFFPLSFSQFPYNDSDAMLFFPLEKVEILRLGGRFADPLPDTQLKATREWKTVPNKTSDVLPSITEETFACEKTGRLYKILPRELAVYSSRRIPLPRKHWFARLSERAEMAKVVYSTNT